MSLADERRSRRFADRGIDPMTFRVFAALVGTSFLAFAAVMIIEANNKPDIRAWLFAGLFASLGLSFLLVSIAGSDSAVERWTNNVKVNSVLCLLMLIAFPIAWAIRRTFDRDAS